MKKRWLSLIALVLAFVMMFALTGCGTQEEAAAPAAKEAETAPAPAEEEADDTVYELRFAVGAVDLEFYTQYADMVTEATDGRVVLQMYNKDNLGTSEDLWVMIQDGSLDMMENSGDEIAGIHPVQQILQIPFFVGDPTTATGLLYALYEEGYMPDWEIESGIETLCFTTSDMQRMASAKADISSADAFNGMVWRCMADAGIQLLNELGATVTTVAAPDVYMSLEKGVLDGSISSPSAMVNFSYQDACDYLLMDGLWCSTNGIVVSAKVWKTLPADIQEALHEVFYELGEMYLEHNLEAEQAGIDTMEAAGVQLVWADESLLSVVEEFSAEYAQTYIENMNSLGYDGQAIYDFAVQWIAENKA